MSAITGAPAAGFAHPVEDSQKSFRALLEALSRPTRPVPLSPPVTAPKGLSASAAALVLTLCDDSTPVWLDENLAADDEIARWIAFHTSAPKAAKATDASFAFISAPERLPRLTDFAPGTDESPHTSTTVIVCFDEGESGAQPTRGSGTVFRADGPGFPEPTTWTAPALPPGFAREWEENHATFPRGVDLVFAGATMLTGLPRTTRLEPNETKEAGY